MLPEILRLRSQVATLTQLLEVHEQSSVSQATKLRHALKEVELSRDQLETRVAERTAELEAATQEALGASRAKSEFLANMSHEIRTPMNGILGMAELGLATNLDPIQREYVETIQSSAELLLGIVNDILDFSKIEAGEVEIEHIDFSFREMLGETLKLLAPGAHSKDIELALSIAPGVPEVLVGDPARIRQVVTNLVGNAIKFTDKGDVIVEVRVVAESEREVDVEVVVSDTGIGIPEEKLGQIWEAFCQVDNSITRSYGGTGLGLTISSQLVTLMGGAIAARSAPGFGSTFRFTLRIPRSSNVRIDDRRSDISKLHHMPTLVVDDHPVNRRILFDLLTNWRMKPTCVAGGMEALAALKQAAADGEPFSLVLLDAMMPGMDGFTVATAIKQTLDVPKVTIMMLSSLNLSDNATRAREHGITRFIAKPVRQSELLDAILSQVDHLERDLGPKEESTRERSARATIPLRILLVEDNLVNRRVAIGLLSNRGHSIAVAKNGREAVDILATEMFDAVLMDLQMPEMGGFEATAVVRAREIAGRPRTPIIAMTAHAMAGDRERCLGAGMDDYVSKPLDIAKLLAALERHTTPVAGKHAAAPCARTLAAPNEVSLSRADVLAILDGDEQLMRDAVAALVEETPPLLSGMRAAVCARDGGGLERAAHNLKSCVGAFGMTAMMQALGALENLGRVEPQIGEPQAAEAQRALRDVETGVDQMVATLSKFVSEGAP